MGVDIELSGIGDLVDTLESMVENASGVEDETLKAAAEPILKDAKQTTAFHDRSDKKLRKALSISKPKKLKGRKYVLTGALNKEVFYARMVEFGTSTADPHPFLIPAYNRHNKEAVQIIADKLKGALK